MRRGDIEFIFDKQLAIHCCNVGLDGDVIISCSKDFLKKYLFRENILQEMIENGPGKWAEQKGWEFQYKGHQVIFTNELTEDEWQLIEMPSNKVFTYNFTEL